MSTLFLSLALFVALLSTASLYRVVVGPTVFDRVIGAGLIGTNALLLLVLVGFIYGRIDMFVDVAIAYALLNFVGVVALGRYFEGRSQRLP
jgi:multicomponent Na+:H+ antiporter subunit F